MNDGPLLLLVEDEVLILAKMEDLLEGAGFSVLTASDGIEAVDILDQRYQGLVGLITDIRLGPQQPDGWAVAHYARELFPIISVVYISGDSVGHWPAEGVPKSIALQKPFSDAQLLATVSNLLNLARGYFDT